MFIWLSKLIYVKMVSRQRILVRRGVDIKATRHLVNKNDIGYLVKSEMAIATFRYGLTSVDVFPTRAPTFETFCSKKHATFGMALCLAKRR
jgi:hypothetical protein